MSAWALLGEALGGYLVYRLLRKRKEPETAPAPSYRFYDADAIAYWRSQGSKVDGTQPMREVVAFIPTKGTNHDPRFH